MNAAHILAKKRNRIKRIQRQLLTPDLVQFQRNVLTQRLNELLAEAKGK